MLLWQESAQCECAEDQAGLQQHFTWEQMLVLMLDGCPSLAFPGLPPPLAEPDRPGNLL